MNRVGRGGVVVFIILTLLAVLSWQPPARGQRPLLRVLRTAADGTFRPVAFRDLSGKLIGFDPDYAAALAERWGIPLDFTTMAFDGLIPALLAKRLDMITIIAITERRKEVVAFSDGVVAQFITSVVRTDPPNFNPGREDIANYRIGLQLNSSASQVLAAAVPGVKSTTYNTIVDAYDDLLLSRIDVVVVESLNAGYTTRAIYPGKLRVSTKNISDAPVWIGTAMRKEDKDLQKAVNDTIREMLADGTIDKFVRKWFGNIKYRL
jgi:ABC-type amino acid transport substrate-binding protein